MLAYYEPQLTRMVCRIIRELLSKSESCSIDDISNRILADAPYLIKSNLTYRVRRSVRSLEITNEIEVEIVESSRQAKKKIIKKIHT